MKNVSRYIRQIDIPEIGLEGQKKIASSSALIIGMGGLGCPSALYLAAAGLGNLGIVDNDIVSVSNLQRQVLYSETDVKKKKVDAAEIKIKSISSDCKVKKYDAEININNVEDIILPYDIILDCTDNFKTRFLLNRACHINKKALVSASLYHYDGQISVFKSYLNSEKHPCYECLYPDGPELNRVPSCKEVGIMGPVAGIFGTMQATVALNEILGIGEGLSGYMLMLDALNFQTSKVKIQKRSNCKCCSGTPPLTEGHFQETECSL